MNALTIALVIAGGAALGIVVWVLAALGRALVKVVETLAAAAVVLFTVWMMIKALVWALRQVVRHWRTSLSIVVLLAWWHYDGLISLVLIVGVITTVFTGWWLVDMASFDGWVGRHLRARWLRWTTYAPKLPQWLHACGLSTTPATTPVLVVVNPLGRRIRRGQRQAQVQLPTVLGVAFGCLVGRGPRPASARPETGRFR